MKAGGVVLKKELQTPLLFLKLSNIIKHHKLILVASALGRYPYIFSTDGLTNSVQGDLTDKEKDRLLAIGETYSVIQVTAKLRELGYSVSSLGIEESLLVSDSTFSRAKIIKSESRFLFSALRESQIVVVPGFIARDEFYHPTTLKREGSDLSAVYYALSVKSKEVIYVKDIDYVARIGIDGYENRFSEISLDDSTALAYFNHFPICYDALDKMRVANLKGIICSRDLSTLCSIDSGYRNRPFVGVLKDEKKRIIITNRLLYSRRKYKTVSYGQVFDI